MATDNSKDNLILGQSLGSELGAPGTWLTGGFISHEEYNTKLLWRRGIDIFDRMRKSDPSIQAILKVCKHPLLASDWNIEAASDQPFDQYVKEFVENELFNRNVKWYKFLRDAFGKLDFGFSVFEKTYEMTEFQGQARIGIASLGWRKQWSILRWETNDGQPGVTQELLSGPVGIPQNKLLVFVNDREGDNYQGVSILRYIYKDWDMKHRIENFMAIAAERSLGVPIVEKSPDMSPNDEKKMREIMRNFRANSQSFIEYPMGMVKLDWMKVETNIRNELIPMLEYLQHEMDKSVLAQFLDLAGSRSGGSAGSHAMAADQSQLFEKALEAVGDEVVGVINEDLIQQLCDLNFSDLPNGYPKIVFSDLGDENLQFMADYLNKLAAVDLLTPDPDLENRIRQFADLPDLPDEIYNNYEDRMSAQTAAVPLVPGGPGQNPNAPQTVVNPLNPSTAMLNKKGRERGDQNNKVTRHNKKADRANMPVPETSTIKRVQTDAIEQARQARSNLVASIMAE